VVVDETLSMETRIYAQLQALRRLVISRIFENSTFILKGIGLDYPEDLMELMGSEIGLPCENTQPLGISFIPLIKTLSLLFWDDFDSLSINTATSKLLIERHMLRSANRWWTDWVNRQKD